MTTSQPGTQMLPRLFWGVLLVSVGVALLVDPYVTVVHISASRLWPLPLIIIGVARMTGGLRRRHRHDGSWLALIGGWLLLNTLTDWQYRQTWPVLIMCLGAKMIWTSFDGPRTRDAGMEPEHVD